MINEINDIQQKLELVCIENLVPKDHLLRLIDKYIITVNTNESTKIPLLVYTITHFAPPCL